MVRTILNFVGITAIFAATLTLAATSHAKGGGGGGKGSSGSKGGASKGGTSKAGTTKGSNNHNHNHHHHHNGGWNNGGYVGGGNNGGYGGDVIDSSSAAEEETMQNVRYLRVRNETGEALRVFVKLEQGGKTFSWNFAPGANAYLAINGEKLATDRVYIWGQSGQKRWAGPHQTSGLTLVSQPYASEEIGTFTYTFNP